jgi:menaquinone reductase, molybdopterin-binding-like subunit
MSDRSGQNPPLKRDFMQRRDFLKISAASGAVAALEGCGNPDHSLIRFVPEEDLVPGIATWKPSICTLCPAGCGMLVRVMQGEAEVVRRGQLGILKMGLAKKLEGNPAHPISQGHLCPRGQAGLQVTYHPDRIKTPLARTGPRGSGRFQEITWDDAQKQLLSHLTALQAGNEQAKITFLTSPLRGQRKMIVNGFASAFKTAPPIEFAFLASRTIQEANSWSFGSDALPTVDLARSNYVISFGADFLGTWNSPVAQSVGYGHMRNGRPGLRGKLVQVESRISQTGASADEWIPSQPGMEGVFALALARVILSEKLATVAAAGHAGALIAGWTEGLPDYAPEAIEKQIGVPAATITRIAREAAVNSPAVALIGDGPAAHTNGFFNALAVNALNAVLGSVGKPGGIVFNPAWASESAKPGATEAKKESESSVRTLADQIHGAPDSVKLLLVDGANPVFATPAAWGVQDALEKISFIASFGRFVDETTVLADLILPDHSPLESWLDDSPDSGSTKTVVSLAPPAMHPLHDTRSMPDVLLDLAHQLGGPVAAALPWKTYDEALKTAYAGLLKQKGSISEADPDDFWRKMKDQGGWWSADDKSVPPTPGKIPPASVKNTAPQFDGDPQQFPFYFLPFASQLYYDGSLAHLPWMQESPDPLSTVMWGTWVEINPRTAERLGIRQGDIVEVSSQHGSLSAPALIAPGIAPNAIAMPIGQGHTNFTRYASGRGANPILILAPMVESGTGSLAWSATRVKISRVAEGKIVMFGASLTDASPELKHR